MYEEVTDSCVLLRKRDLVLKDYMEQIMNERNGRYNDEKGGAIDCV